VRFECGIAGRARSSPHSQSREHHRNDGFFLNYRIGTFAYPKRLQTMAKLASLLFLLLLTSQADAQDERSYIDSVRKHHYIIFSFTGTASREVSRYRDHINNHFSRLDYKILDSLYHAEKGILQFYAFLIICKKFPERINDEHKKMLDVGDQIMVLTGSQTEPGMLPKKDIAAMLHKHAMETLETQKHTEKAVQSFIRDYARFPESYEPILFEKFHLLTTTDPKTGKTDEKTKMHVIGHRYWLKDSLGTTVECYNTFKLNSVFMMNIIEAEESDIFSSFPPKINDWLKLYGRVLSEEDKNRLGYNRIEFDHKR
jgi:hypothetical protein